MALIFIADVGAPGSGKGTICNKISQDFGFFHFSVGDHLRTLSRDHSFNHREVVCDYLQRGELLPGEIIMPILREKINEERKKGQHHILVDGFPRNLGQLFDFWIKVESPSETLVISLECPKETAKQRYLTRRLPGRLDDDEKMFEKRYAQFQDENPFVIDIRSCLVEKLNSSTETEVTYATLLETVGKKYGWERKVEVALSHST